MLTKALAEFEMAHIWLFSVGLFYVLNTITFMVALRSIKTDWDRFDSIHTEAVQKLFMEDGGTSAPAPGENPMLRDWKWSGVRRGKCRYLFCGAGDGAAAAAEFKVLKLYFIQQHWLSLQ